MDDFDSTFEGDSPSENSNSIGYGTAIGYNSPSEFDSPITLGQHGQRYLQTLEQNGDPVAGIAPAKQALFDSQPGPYGGLLKAGLTRLVSAGAPTSGARGPESKGNTVPGSDQTQFERDVRSASAENPSAFQQTGFERDVRASEAASPTANETKPQQSPQSAGGWKIVKKKTPTWFDDAAGVVTGAAVAAAVGGLDRPSEDPVTKDRRQKTAAILGTLAGKLSTDYYNGNLYYPWFEYSPPPETPDEAARRQQVEVNKNRIREAMQQDGVYDPGYGRPRPESGM